MLNRDKRNIFSGFHGRFNDDIVFKQRQGKTILCCYPKGQKVKWTENQKEHRVKFKLATMYAGSVMKNPEKLLFYQEREHDDINAYNLAIADYLKRPVISSIQVRKSRERGQYLVQVRATDEFIITGVEIQLFDLSGKFMERVHATQFRHTARWIYKIERGKLGTVALIKAIADDYAGHCAVMDYLISPEDAIKWLPHSKM